jgi:integrase
LVRRGRPEGRQGRNLGGHDHPELSHVGLAPTTIAQHRSYLDSLILPTFAAVPLSAITATQIRAWVADLDTAGKAPATIAKALVILRAILAQAVEDQKLARSPAAVKIELPKAPHRAMTVLTVEQVADLADAAGPFYRTHLLTAAQTGLRWGELAGLPLTEVNTLRGEIKVAQQLLEIAGHLEISSQLKTGTSRRTVTIGGQIAALIGEHAGRFPTESGLVFTTTEGAMLRRSNFARSVLKPAAAAIGVPQLRFHDLRHTHASLLLGAGESVPAVAKRLGHRSTLTTMRTYAHAIPGTERSAADQMDTMFGSVPTTLAGWRGQNEGSGEIGAVIDLPRSL